MAPAITTVVAVLKVEASSLFQDICIDRSVYIQNYEEECEGKGHPACVRQSIEIVSFFLREAGY